MLLAEAFLTPARSAVYSQYGFAIYPLVIRETGAQAIEVPALRATAICRSATISTAMAAAIDADTRLVFIANPNNPTGTWARTAAVKRLLERAPPSTLVVLDEAYFEYGRERGTPGWRAVAGRASESGHRCAPSPRPTGWPVRASATPISHPEVAEVLNRLRPAFNVNSHGAGRRASRRWPIRLTCAVRWQRTMRELHARRARRSARWGCGARRRPPISCWCASVAGARRCIERLLRRGVIVRPVAGYGLPDCLRISIGLPEHNDRLLRERSPHALSAHERAPAARACYRAASGRERAGELRVPGDKSISHRALMLGGIAAGPDRRSTAFWRARTAWRRSRRCVRWACRSSGRGEPRCGCTGSGVHGLRAAAAPLDMGNAGTAMRLFMGLLAGQRFDSTLIGDASLMRRPMERVAAPLRAMGARIDTRRAGRRCAFTAARRCAAIDYTMPMASAQVKSALLLAALYAEGTHQRHRAGADARSHRAHAARLRRAARCAMGRACSIAGGQPLHGCPIEVPGDFSSAAFFIVAGCLARARRAHAARRRRQSDAHRTAGDAAH